MLRDFSKSRTRDGVAEALRSLDNASVQEVSTEMDTTYKGQVATDQTHVQTASMLE